MSQTITALFDSRTEANDSASKLREMGVLDSDITVSPETAREELTGSSTERGGFWGYIESMFGGGGDHQTYAEGVRRGGVIVTVNTQDDKIDHVMDVLEQHGSVDLDERENTWRKDGWQTTPVAVSSASHTPSSASGHRDDVLKVVEEDLDVGKRAVNRGKVRIHSYVVERPVTENVTLHQETVAVERRPVDRPATAADLGADAFKNRTIEMDETHEEAVVSKTARVVEEVSLSKQSSDRVETVKDTLRSTKVDVEDGRSEMVGQKGVVGNDTSVGSKSVAQMIEDDMEVIGSDGQHIGAVDHVDGDMIKLKKMDAADFQHHLVPMGWVGSVDTRVKLTLTANDAKARWTAAA